jgi:hypothetical protein
MAGQHFPAHLLILDQRQPDRRQRMRIDRLWLCAGVRLVPVSRRCRFGVGVVAAGGLGF